VDDVKKRGFVAVEMKIKGQFHLCFLDRCKCDWHTETLIIKFPEKHEQQQNPIFILQLKA
jgi:hypothetical protein